MSIRTMTRWGAGFALAGALVVGSGAGAFAHDCIISSRSAQGNTSAGSNSQAWFTLDVEEALAGDVESGLITADQADCILDAYSATGSPLSFTVHAKGANGNDGVLSANNPNDELMLNHHGVDSLFGIYGEDIIGSFISCGAGFGGE